MTVLAGARVLITGASRGIGVALVRSFAARGAVPILVARDAKAIGELAAELGGTAHPADLTGPIDGLIATIEEAAGPIDILVNNAGINHPDSIFRQQAGPVHQMLDLNLRAPIELCRQVLPGMLERGRGHLVNVSSVGANAVFPGMATYSASKAGLTHFTAGLRADLRGLPVRTTLVDLGPVPTDTLTDSKRFRPAADAYRRFYRARLLVDVPTEKVADRVVRAVERDRRHVRIPRRTAAMAMLAEAPRRTVELLLTGISHQDRA